MGRRPVPLPLLAALVALAALVTTAAIVGAGLTPGASGSSEQGAGAALPLPDPSGGSPRLEGALPGAQSERRAVELEVPPPAASDVEAPPIEHVGAPLAAPPRGHLRLAGRVELDGEPFPAVPATVRVHLGDPDEGRACLLGVANVRGGTFRLDFPGEVVEELGRYGAAQATVAATLVAPGYEVVTEYAFLQGADEDVLTVTLSTSGGRYLVQGRVLTASGAPLAAADVLLVALGRVGEEVLELRTHTGADGRFALTTERGGFVDVLASHAGHGVAKAGGRFEDGVRALDLGPLVLESLGVIAGTLQGTDGRPLGRHDVYVLPADEGSEEPGVELVTDEAGRFCAACLAPIPYRVSAYVHSGDSDDWPIATPDVRELALVARVPSAVVTVVDPDGAPVPGLDLVVRPLRRSEGGWTIDTGAQITLGEGERGRYHVTFSRRGTYNVGAAFSVGDVYWTGSTRVDVGDGRSEAVVRLEPQELARVTLEVEGPDGAAVEDWLIRLIDPRTGLSGAYRRAKRPTGGIAPGQWRAHIEPRGDTLVLPFEADVEVRPDTERLILRATELGGTLTVEVDSAGPQQLVVSAPGSRTQRLRVKGGEPALFPQALPAGRHVIVVQGTRPPIRREVTIRPGERAWVRITVP